MANPMYGQNAVDNKIQDGRHEVLYTEESVTLTAAQSGATVFVNAAAKVVTLPAAKAGLNYRVILGVDTTAGAKISAASGDCFFGQIKVLSTTDDKTEVQDIDYATATGTVASYDVLDFTSNSATLAGTSGDVIEVMAVDDVAWCVLACLTTVHAEPASTAIINAS
tara:strand:- start:34 stop:531 length:498 start_codon:yes stop_codon:yes gene_type:complete